MAQMVNSENATYNGSKYYKLMADISLYTYGSGYNGGKGWIPIGNTTSSATCFSGTFDGNNHMISGLYINDPAGTLYFYGLFGDVYATEAAPAVIKNLGLLNVERVDTSKKI